MTVAEHFGALEADFQSQYGLDLRAALWGPDALGTRRIYQLVVNLGPDTALGRKLMLAGLSPPEPEPKPATTDNIRSFFGDALKVTPRSTS